MNVARCLAGIGLLMVALAPGVATAVTPESPDVQALVKAGLEILEKNAAGNLVVGEKALIGLSFIKANQPQHPLVTRFAQEIRGHKDWNTVENYSLPLAIIFLTELGSEDQQDTQESKQVVQKLLDLLVSRQKNNGGWGYSGHGAPGKSEPTGDVSQTQYACLALWSAKRYGANVPQQSVENVCEWLLRVQDPSGAWGYQGVDPGPGNYTRVPQRGAVGPVTHSLAAAGLGSVCVCADLLGMRDKGRVGREQTSDLPQALKVVKKPTSKFEPFASTRVDAKLVKRAIDDGSSWFAKNYSIDTGQPWNMYYLYGLERCESFREHYYAKYEDEPKWYNDGVAFWAKRTPTGWNGDHSQAASTSFAILFLMRSAHKAIAEAHDLGDGVLTSGKGLPADLANATVKRGKLVDSLLEGEVDDLLKLLEDPENPELARVLDSGENLKLDADLTKRTSQITKLRSMVSAGNWEARMVAVRTLGKSRDLDSVPVLLYALTDPDKRVVLEADAALKFISRKLHGVGLPADPTKEDQKQARLAWRKWYLSIRPNAELLD